MSNYCDFNPQMFKEFTSMHKKITPTLTDDWEIIPESWRSNDGFSLKSKKLDQQIADINLRRFLRFCKEQNVEIKGLKLTGLFIIGKDRAVYTEDMFKQWQDKFKKRTETLIPRSEWIPGHKYLTPCGQTQIYLGSRYVSNIKESALQTGKYDEFTKVTKKYYVYNTSSHYKTASEFKGKFTKDLGKAMEKSETDNILEEFYNDSANITCFEENKPENVEYGLIEVEPFCKKRYKNIASNVLIVKSGNKTYVSSTHSLGFPIIKVDEDTPPPPAQRYTVSQHHWKNMDDAYNLFKTHGTGYFSKDFIEVDPITYQQVNNNRHSGYRSHQWYLKIDKFYRIGLKGS